MEKVNKLCNRILADLEKIPKETKEYQDKFLALAPLCSSLYPEEYDNFLKSIGLKDSLSLWKEKAQEMINQVDSYGLNFRNQTIEVNLGSETLAMPLIDLARYLSINLKLKAPTWQYMLALSAMAQAETYELFQISNAIILSE